MRKLLESMTKFAGEPAQKPGDQVRGTERATKKKSGQHPFQGRLVGGESIFRELEQQLVEGDVERRLREEFEQFNEFAPPGDDGDDDGFDDETLKRLAAAWWHGDEDPRVERTLAAAGWEIGQDEGYDDEPGVFVVQAGDINGNSYVSWSAEDLKGLGEGIFGFMSKPESKPKAVPADEFTAKLIANRQQKKTTPPKEKIYRGPEEYRKDREVDEEQINELGANNPPQPTAAGAVPPAGTPVQTGQPAPVDPKDAAALKQSLAKLKTSVPGLDITKATTTMAKADTGTKLNPGDQKIASTFAPELANVMKNPQMAGQLKMMIDKANQQEKATAAAKPNAVTPPATPGTPTTPVVPGTKPPGTV